MDKKFIKATESACSFENHVAAPYIRKSFVIPFKPEKAIIDICGLGFYELYINGSRITKGALAPYISNPEHYCYIDEYDVTKYLHDGENVVGVILGNGFFNSFGGAVWDFDKAPWTGAPILALEFTAESAGNRYNFSADESFKVHSSPIIFDELRMGEYYDASKELCGWSSPGFDDSTWKNAICTDAPRGDFKLCEAEPIRIQKELKPVNIFRCTDGYIYDFGENNAGVCRLEINAIPGQRIELRHGELLKDGELDISSIIFGRTGYYYEYNQKDVYIAKGENKEVYVPSFTYHGFRYVLVKGITSEQATTDLLTYLVMSSDMKTIGDFKCSDETVNTLFDMVKRSDRSNFYYFPTDCPHREKNGWTGDASLSAAHMALLYDTEKSWREWLHNIRKAQTESGMLPGIVPTAGWGYEWGNGPAWDSVLFNLPYQLYKCRGCIDVIKENETAMMNYLQYAISRCDSDGTLAIGLGDWVPVGKKASDYDAPLALTDTVMLMDMARKAELMFKEINSDGNAEYACEIYKKLRTALRKTMIDTDTLLVKGNSESSQAIALYYGLFNEDEKEQAFARLLELIKDNNDSMDGGFIGLRALFHVLSEFGYTDMAFNMITKSEYPSYGHLIELGETTIVEQIMPDGVPCGSHNHHFLGDISRWFIENIGGLKIIDSRTVEINPKPPKNITSAEAYYDFSDGRISVSWKRDESGINMNIKNQSGAKLVINMQPECRICINCDETD